MSKYKIYISDPPSTPLTVPTSTSSLGHLKVTEIIDNSRRPIENLLPHLWDGSETLKGTEGQT